MVHPSSCIAGDGEKLFFSKVAPFLLKFFLKKRSDLAELADPEARSSLDIFRREGFDF